VSPVRCYTADIEDYTETVAGTTPGAGGAETAIIVPVTLAAPDLAWSADPGATELVDVDHLVVIANDDIDDGGGELTEWSLAWGIAAAILVICALMAIVGGLVGVALNQAW
jgi:hypothetical protein